MPVTPSRYYVTTMTAPMTAKLLLLLFMLITPLAGNVDGAVKTASATEETSPMVGEGVVETANAENDSEELLRTETTLIDALRLYIETLETKISIIKRKTLAIKSVNDGALNNTEKYVNNPINSVTIIKRFTADWKALRQYAANAINTDEIMKDIATATESLKFPDEDDYDEAAGNLLRIQDIYNLEPARIAVGEMNGVKFGSEMTWSDCLEIGRKSNQNGDYAIAKFWMETALEKVTTAANDTTTTRHMTNEAKHSRENAKARYEIMEALLFIEYKAGHNEVALEIVQELLQSRPTHKGLLKDKETIERALKKQSLKSKNYKKFEQKYKKEKAKKNDKSAEEQLIEEICRASTTTTITTTSATATTSSSSSKQFCALERYNLPQLLLQPLHVEYLQLEPYIVLYHHALHAKELLNLRELVEEQYTYDNDESDFVEDLQFTKMAQKKLTHINQRFAQITGHAPSLWRAPWHVESRNYQDDMYFEALVQNDQPRLTAANVLFNVQQSKLGGNIVFPQLELSVTVPPSALLYWSNLNEFREEDYRVKQYVCPVIAGTQIMAYTAISTVKAK